MTPELQAQITVWRQKALAGTLSLEETKEAIIIMRAGRAASSRSSDSAKRTSAKKQIKAADDLIDELENL